MLNPKFKPGDMVVVGEGLLVGTISAIIYDRNGIKYKIEEHPVMFEEYELTPLDNTDIVTIDLNDYDGFEIGDLVTIKGYSSIFTIVGHNEDKTEFVVKQYMMEEIADEMVAFPEDMELADEEDVEEYEQQSIIAREFEHNMTFIMKEFEPTDILGIPGKQGKSKFRSKEKEILTKLEHNRKVVSTLKEWQDWFYEMYLFTNDEKYIRRIKRVQGWMSKIPTRAYQIK